MTYCLEHIRERWPELGSETNDASFRQLLLNRVEAVKIELSSTTSATISLVVGDNSLIAVPVTREIFESVSADLFDRLLEPIQAVLTATDLSGHYQLNLFMYFILYKTYSYELDELIFIPF